MSKEIAEPCIYMIQKHQSTDLSQGRMIVTTARCVQVPAWLNLQAKYCPYCGREIVYRNEEDDVQACKERIIEQKIEYLDQQVARLVKEKQELENKLEEVFEGHEDCKEGGNK